MTSTWDNILKNEIKNADLLGVRSVILRQINSDREADKITLMSTATYAEKELTKKEIVLFEKDDGEQDFTIPRKSWNKELWQSMRVDFEYNFSREKLDFIQKIMMHLRKAGNPYFQKALAHMHGPGGGQDPEIKKSSIENEQKLQKKMHHKQDNGGKKIQADQDKYWLAAGIGAILGISVGSLLKIAVPGAIAGASLGIGLAFIKKNS